jgi:hypothetical protein
MTALKTLAIAAALVATVIPAKAEPFPNEMLGTWCVEYQDSYSVQYIRKQDCNEPVVFGQDGYVTETEFGCKFTRKTRDRIGATSRFSILFSYEAKCANEVRHFVQRGRIGIRADFLFLDWIER